MTRASRLCHGIHRLALTAWISVLIAALVARAGAMSILPDLGLTIDEFLAYDLSEHGRIAAEKLMEPILTFVDLVQLVAASFVMGTMALQGTVFRIPSGPQFGRGRILCLTLASVMFVIRAAFVMPSLNRTLRAYWEAARLAQTEAAAGYRESLDVTQTMAAWMLGATLALLLIAVAITPAATVTDAKGAPRLEPPALLRDPPRP